jgi:hypothetical protein
MQPGQWKYECISWLRHTFWTGGNWALGCAFYKKAPPDGKLAPANDEEMPYYRVRPDDGPTGLIASGQKTGFVLIDPVVEAVSALPKTGDPNAAD